MIEEKKTVRKLIDCIVIDIDHLQNILGFSSISQTLLEMEETLEKMVKVLRETRGILDTLGNDTHQRVSEIIKKKLGEDDEKRR